MNILYIHSTPLDYQQANVIQVLNMCHAFSKTGIKVTLLIRASEKHGVNSANWIKLQFGIEVKFRIIFFKSNFSILGHFKELGVLLSPLRKVIRYELLNGKYDVIYLRNPLLLLLIKIKLVPIVFELHNNILHPESKILGILYEKLLLNRYREGRIKKLIVISNALKIFWEHKGIDPSKMLCSHDGFNSDHFSVNMDKHQARKLLSIKTNKKVISYTGSLYEDRGIDIIIRAAREIPDALFLVVGGPNAIAENYRKQISDSKIENIIFTGRLDQQTVVKYLFASDILLLIFTDKVPTINFCSPLKLFEYMASGRIILGHSFPTIKEVLEDGRTAFFAEPNNQEEFIKKLRNILGGNHAAMGEAARTDAFNKYSWEKRAQFINNFIFS